MKKVLGMVAVLMLVSASAFAVDTVKNGKYGAYVDGAYAIADVGTGYAVDVDGDGALAVSETLSSASYQIVDATAVAVPAVVKAISFTGITAGDTLLVENDRTVIFDIRVGTAKQTQNVVIPGGVAFATDVYVDFVSGTDNGSCTIIYN